MKNKEEFNFLLDRLLENAGKEFRETKQYGLLQEKMEQMDRDWRYHASPRGEGICS